MSMRKLLALTSIGLALMPSGTMYDSEPARTRRKSNYKMPERNYQEPLPLSEELLVIKDLHKGHTSEEIEFSFNWQDKILKIKSQISYGSSKARLKAISHRQGQLAEYIKNTNLSYIAAFKQFVIEDLNVPAPKQSPSQMRNKIPQQTKFGEKGDYEGVCNRSACVTNIAALYYNHSTQKHYCRVCAKMINDMNPESYEMYGHQLCTLV